MLNKYDIKYKKFIKLQNRLMKLYEELRKLPNVKLKSPYQKGWIIKYELRDDIKNREDADIIQECLNIGYHSAYTNNVKIVKAIRRKESISKLISSFGDKCGYVYFLPQRYYMSDKEYKITRNLNKYFILDEYWDNYKKNGKKRYYLEIPQYWLVLKVRPYIITHKKLKGGKLEQEYDYLYDKVYRSGEFDKFITNYGKSYSSSSERTKMRNKIQKFKNGEIDDIYNDKIPLIYEY